VTTEAASAMPDVPLVAFIGESQVGKSSLVNALAGARLLPTTGTGAPRSQAVCEWFVSAVPQPEVRWRVSATWLPPEAIRKLAGFQDVARARLLREGLGDDQDGTLGRAFRSLSGASTEPDLVTWAAGRDATWLPLDTAHAAVQAQRQVEVLTTRWPAALACSVRIRGEGAASVCLVDLPGLGHEDLGGEASADWLAAHAPRVAAIVCVVGKRTPELLEDVLHKHWLVDELRCRLYVVATFADHLVEDAANEADRRRAADARRVRAAEHLRSLIRERATATDVLPRTFCLDPRNISRFWRKVEFDGELDRLRKTLTAIRPPPPRRAVLSAPVSESRITAPEVPEPLQPIPPRSPLALQRGENIELWLSRSVVPMLRKATWESEALRSGRQRMHLKASDSRGNLVTFVTIYGTGEAYFVASTRKVRLPPPNSEAAGKMLHDQLADAALGLGLADLGPIPLHIGRAL
jgi:GTP-binding protein EngB required for normal cell division